MSEPAEAGFVLPAALISRADLARLLLEVESIESQLESQKVRNRGKADASYHLPTMSQSLSDFLDVNKLDLADDQGRMLLTEQLRVLKDKAPTIHMTFSVGADPHSLGLLVDWLRKEVHPQALVSVGLQPALVGGAYVRTPNKVHDFSMRSLMQGKRNVMINELEKLR